MPAIITVETLLKDDPAIGKLTKAKLLEKLAKEMEYATRIREDYDRLDMKLWHALREIDDLERRLEQAIYDKESALMDSLNK